MTARTIILLYYPEKRHVRFSLSLAHTYIHTKVFTYFSVSGIGGSYSSVCLLT